MARTRNARGHVRLTEPLVRVSGELRPASWDEALDRVVAAVRRTQAEHGRDAVGCFGGGSLTNEQAYQFGKFARVALRTSAIDYNGRFCMSSAAGAAVRGLGLEDMRAIAGWIDEVVGAVGDDALLARVAGEVRERCARHPAPGVRI